MLRQSDLSAQFDDISYLALFDRKGTDILFGLSLLFPPPPLMCVCFFIVSYFHQQRGLVVYVFGYFTSFW
jgi:hypothetical protein